MFAAIYVRMPLGMLVAIRHFRAGQRPSCSSAPCRQRSSQYCVSRLPKTAAGAVHQPEETIEGATGDLVCGIAFMMIAGARMIPFVGYGPLFVLGLLRWPGICGDLLNRG